MKSLAFILLLFLAPTFALAEVLVPVHPLPRLDFKAPAKWLASVSQTYESELEKIARYPVNSSTKLSMNETAVYSLCPPNDSVHIGLAIVTAPLPIKEEEIRDANEEQLNKTVQELVTTVKDKFLELGWLKPTYLRSERSQFAKRLSLHLFWEVSDSDGVEYDVEQILVFNGSEVYAFKFQNRKNDSKYAEVFRAMKDSIKIAAPLTVETGKQPEGTLSELIWLPKWVPAPQPIPRARNSKKPQTNLSQF